MDELTFAKFLYDFGVVGLTAGLFSGVVSGLLVDYLIRQREAKLWAPTKNLLYAALLDILRELFHDILPLVVAGRQFRHFTSKVYVFGEETAMPFWDIVDDADVTITNAALIKTLRGNWLAETEFARQAQPEIESKAPPPPQIAAMKRARNAIRGAVQAYAVVIDPELRAAIGRLSADLDSVIGAGSQPIDWLETDNASLYLNPLVGLMRKAVELRNRLLASGEVYADLTEWLSRRG